MADFELQFEWDERKNRLNQRKHGISFELAVRVFDDPFQLTIPDREMEREVRWRTIGMAEGMQVLFVAHTLTEFKDEEVCRIISARRATPVERSIYGSQIKNR
jgi:hypothetical protein